MTGPAEDDAIAYQLAAEAYHVHNKLIEIRPLLRPARTKARLGRNAS